jgi:hypothetical protein
LVGGYPVAGLGQACPWPAGSARRLLRVHLETIFIQPFGEHAEETFSLTWMLKGVDQVVGVPDALRTATEMGRLNRLKPLVPHGMQIDIRQDRRRHAIGTKDNFEFERQIPPCRSDSLGDLRRKK